MGKDCYSYLQSKEMDLRFKKALEMIGSVKGKVILDLNCGTARILQYLPKGFAQYVGNDINEEFLEVAKNWKAKGPIMLIPCRDDEVAGYLARVDIFMHFGINAGVNKGIESETELETFKKIVEKFSPETVVCGAWFEYEKMYKVISQRSGFLIKAGYKETSSLLMTKVDERLLVVHKRS